eukprot:gene407-429_t
MSLNASPVSATLPEILPADPALTEGTIVFAEAEFVPQTTHAEIAAGSKDEGDKCTRKSMEMVAPVAIESNSEDINDAVDKALRHVDYLEIDRLLCSGSWLFAFISACENLPICITLSTANRNRIGFPLIYVNAFFERMTGYKREHIMGANCKFLQRNSTGVLCSEADSVQRLTIALRTATPVKVALTNYRRSGEPFKNLLAMKPVFSSTREYLYVIGVQFDLSSQLSSAHCLRVLDRLLALLPDMASF